MCSVVFTFFLFGEQKETKTGKVSTYGVFVFLMMGATTTIIKKNTGFSLCLSLSLSLCFSLSLSLSLGALWEPKKQVSSALRSRETGRLKPLLSGKQEEEERCSGKAEKTPFCPKRIDRCNIYGGEEKPTTVGDYFRGGRRRERERAREEFRTEGSWKLGEPPQA